MNNLFKVFMGLFLPLFMAVSFTACDDDGKEVDGVVKIENFSVSVVPANYGNTYEYSWKGVEGAYSYRVFYKEKGSSDEWNETNIHIPNPNKPGQIMTSTMMGGYGKDVVYEMKIIAYKDSFSKIIAESDIIESEPLPL